MAAPHPQRELDRLDKQLASKDPGQLFAIQGPCRWFRDQALDKLRNRFAKQGQIIDFDGKESGASQSDVGGFLMDLRTPDLFGASKMLLLRQGERVLKTHGKLFVELLDHIVPGNQLVLDVNKLDGRTAFGKSVKKAGGSFEFRNLYDKPFRDHEPASSAEIVRWLADRARTMGLTLTAEAALFVVQVVGSEPALLVGELERLAPLFEGKKIGPGELRSQLTTSFGSTQFELVEALLDGDLKAALRSLNALEREGLRDKEGKRLESGAVFPMVASWLSTCLGNLTQARAEVDGGDSPGAAASRHGGFFRERFERQLRRHDRSSLALLHEALIRGERRLRTTGEDPILLLERLILEALARRGRTSLMGQGELRAW